VALLEVGVHSLECVCNVLATIGHAFVDTLGAIVRGAAQGTRVYAFIRHVLAGCVATMRDALTLCTTFVDYAVCGGRDALCAVHALATATAVGVYTHVQHTVL
jgi:hypothetical protein